MSEQGAAMNPVGSSPYRERQARQIKERPLSVTLIAMFQFSRAVAVLLIFLFTSVFHDEAFGSAISVKILTYIAARQPLPPAALLPIIMPLIAAYLSTTGFGLWFLKKWARNLVMVTSGGTAVLWIRAFIYYGAIKEPIFKSDLQCQTVMVVVLLDIIVFAYLYMEGRAFGESD
jgi:hypothetical protein